MKKLALISAAILIAGTFLSSSAMRPAIARIAQELPASRSMSAAGIVARPISCAAVPAGMGGAASRAAIPRPVKAFVAMPIRKFALPKTEADFKFDNGELVYREDRIHTGVETILRFITKDKKSRDLLSSAKFEDLDKEIKAKVFYQGRLRNDQAFISAEVLKRARRTIRMNYGDKSHSFSLKNHPRSARSEGQSDEDFWKRYNGDRAAGATANYLLQQNPGKEIRKIGEDYDASSPLDKTEKEEVLAQLQDYSDITGDDKA